jgi:hypothetical protein
MPERAGNRTNNTAPLSITIDVLTLKSPAIYLVQAHDFTIITLLLGSNEGAKVDSGVARGGQAIDGVRGLTPSYANI